MTTAPTHVAFLRAINVGGHTARREQLVRAVESLGLTNVSTFLASGNVLFRLDRTDRTDRDTATLEDSIAEALGAELGFDVATFVRSAQDLAVITSRSPFPGVAADTGTLQVGLLHRTVRGPARAAVLGLTSGVDQLAVIGREVYWHTTGRMMDSPLGRGPTLARAVGQETTWRNLHTVRRLAGRMGPATA